MQMVHSMEQHIHVLEQLHSILQPDIAIHQQTVDLIKMCKKRLERTLTYILSYFLTC